MKALAPTLVVLVIIGVLGICGKIYLQHSREAQAKITATNGPVVLDVKVGHVRFDQQ